MPEEKGSLVGRVLLFRAAITTILNPVHIHLLLLLRVDRSGGVVEEGAYLAWKQYRVNSPKQRGKVRKQRDMRSCVEEPPSHQRKGQHNE